MLILMKIFCPTSINLTKKIKLHPFFKHQDQIKTKKILDDQLDIFRQNKLIKNRI